MVTDPPYGVNYDPQWREEYDQFEMHSVGKVENDDTADWTDAWQLFEGDVAYVWHAGVFAADVAMQLASTKLQIRNQIVWRKQHFVFGRGAYHWQHEPCWYAVRKGKSAQWCGDRTQSTVWDISNANPMGGGDREEKTTHGTEKPLECMARPIRNHGDVGDIVYEPFSGSGTTIIACEQLGRKCRAVEISAAYTAVAIDRWATATGQTPVLIS
jgi:DNA modification methylase